MFAANTFTYSNINFDNINNKMNNNMNIYPVDNINNSYNYNYNYNNNNNNNNIDYLNYQNQNQNQFPQPQQQPQPQPQPIVSQDAQPNGGVSSVLDYDLDQMMNFLSWITFGLVKRSIDPSINFQKLVSSVLSATRLPKSTLLLAINYISNKMDDDDEGFYYNYNEEDIFKILITSLILSNKFNDDKTFRNKSWSDATNLPLIEINNLERSWLIDCNYQLFKTESYSMVESCWNTWCLKNNNISSSISSIPSSPLSNSYNFINSNQYQKSLNSFTGIPNQIFENPFQNVANKVIIPNNDYYNYNNSFQNNDDLSYYNYYSNLNSNQSYELEYQQNQNLLNIPQQYNNNTNNTNTNSCYNYDYDYEYNNNYNCYSTFNNNSSNNTITTTTNNNNNNLVNSNAFGNYNTNNSYYSTGYNDCQYNNKNNYYGTTVAY